MVFILEVEMNIEEVRKLKRDTECSICELLNNFMEKTDCVVDSFSMEKIEHNEICYKKVIISDIKLDISI